MQLRGLTNVDLADPAPLRMGENPAVLILPAEITGLSIGLGTHPAGIP
jgi:hypothetical protein